MKYDFLEKAMAELKTADLPDIDYENTILKEQAEDIKSPQQEIIRKLDDLSEESRRSSALALRISLATLVVGVLTLIATVIFGILR